MITRFDDYCVHQTYRPVAEPCQSDRNFYDRYWFNGLDAVDHEWIFEVGLGLYPNRRVMDGHFSVTIGDRQYAFHSSRRAPRERDHLVIGPFSVTIEEPMRRIRVTLGPNDHRIECDLLFTARSIPHEEPVNQMVDDGHLIMRNTRFTQLGRWQGHFSIDDNRVEVDRAPGTRDKSWGVRPVGEPAGGAPSRPGGDLGVYWVWNPLDYGDFCTQMGSFEDREGRPTQLSAHRMPLYDNPVDIPGAEDPLGIVPMRDVEHELEFATGTRRPTTIRMAMSDPDGTRIEVEMIPHRRFHMTGIGYNHPEWGHGMWKGELATAREEWALDEVDELSYPFLHIQQLVTATMTDSDGGRFAGVGAFESIIIGRHARSGLRDYFDGADPNTRRGGHPVPRRGPGVNTTGIFS